MGRAASPRDGDGAELADDLEDVRTALARYRSLVEQMQFGLYVYHLEDPGDDRTLRMVEVNAAAEKLTGVAARDLVGKTLDECFPGLRRQDLPRKFADVARSREPVQYLDFEYGDDRVPRRAWAFKVIPLPGSHVGVVFEDVSERERAREAETALRESEERFRTLVENAPEAIVVFDVEKGHFVQFNENAERLFKCPREELFGLGPLDLSPERQPDGRLSEPAARRYLELAARGERPAFEWTHQDREGLLVPCEVRLVRLSAAHPNLIRGSMTDISERKRQERERMEFEAQLQQAQRLESLGVLAGGIAHDFNNLLVGVRGYATLALAELEKGHPLRRRLEEIDLAASRAAELTNQLLMYSGKSRLQRERVDLGELLAEVEKLLGAAVSKRTRLRYELAPEPLFVLGDRSQIQQVAMNLITNASEAMGEEGGTVVVRTAVEAATGDDGEAASPTVGAREPGRRYHLLEVTDEGPGMDEETQSRILEPFFSTKFTGRGLGLATVSGIVRSHQGTLSVTSSPGHGARFEVRLPAAEPPSAGDAPAADGGWRGEGTVLLVDDEETVRDLLRAHLRHLGFDVVEAHNGREALAGYRGHRRELVAILMDQTMPEMNGVEAARELRRLGCEVPILMLSGYVREDVFRGDPAGGVAGFLQKPFSFEALRRTLRGLLS